jgi:branched-subunit amino acid aminotransferase/4-amino-4-deoxychorismate lyase
VTNTQCIFTRYFWHHRAENTHLLFWSQHFERLEKGRMQLKINPVSEKMWLEDISKSVCACSVIVFCYFLTVSIN